MDGEMGDGQPSESAQADHANRRPGSLEPFLRAESQTMILESTMPMAAGIEVSRARNWPRAAKKSSRGLTPFAAKLFHRFIMAGFRPEAVEFDRAAAGIATAHQQTERESRAETRP